MLVVYSAVNSIIKVIEINSVMFDLITPLLDKIIKYSDNSN